MYYVYVLRNSRNRDVYVGYTTNLKERFRTHNLGKVKSTKPDRPWTLVYYEAYKSKLDSTKREKQLKMHAAKNELLARLKNSLKRW